MSSAATTNPAGGRRLAIIELTALSALLFSILLRLFVSIDPFPYWSADPFEFPVEVTGLGPTALAALDLLALASAAAAFFAAGARGLRPPLWQFGLFLAGSGAVLVHVGVNERWVLEHLQEGLPLIAAMAAGLVCATLGRDPARRRLILAALLAALAMLAAKGVLQVYVEHPETLRRFRVDRESFLAAQGWAPGSSSALAFERRLSQAEASGWIGLANPYATLMAAGVVAFAGWFLAALRRRADLESWVAPMLGAGLAVCSIGLVLAGGKGGFGAAAIGLAMLGLFALAARGRSGARGLPARLARAADSRFAGFIGPGVVLAVLVAVALRGVIGERIGELSILFRAFYIEAAARIFAENPLLGVGPAGFKSAYLLAKNPLSPEEVSSPHSLFFDLAAKLGLGGLCWGAIVVFWSWAAGRAVLRADHKPDPDSGLSGRNEARVVLLIVVVAAMLAALLEAPMATPELALMRLAGIVGAACFAAAILATARVIPGAPVAAAAGLAVLAHGQIEVTPILASTAPWFLALLAVAGAKDGRPFPAAAASPGISISPRLVRIIAAPILLLAMVGWIAFHSLTRTLRWESHLRAGAAIAYETFEVRDILQKPNPSPAELQRVSELMSAVTPTPPGTSPGTLRDLFPTYRVYKADDVLRLHLEPALIIAPSHFGAARAASRISMSPVYRGLREPHTLSLLNRTLAHSPERALVQSWMGVVSASAFEQSGETDALRRACVTWEEAAAFDPHSTFHPIQLAEAYAKLGEADQARSWAKRALTLDANLRLDPLKRMAESTRRRMEALAGPAR